MQFTLCAVHLALQRGIDGALLLHAVHAFEAGVDHFGRKMRAIIALHSDAGVGKARRGSGLRYRVLRWPWGFL